MQYSKKRVINREIPDNDPNGLVDRIEVTKNLSVHNVSLNVNIKHPYNGDISIELSSPSGTKKVIHSPSRAPGKNISKNFNGDIMQSFAGGKSKGEWTLRVVDSGARDSGSVQDWTLSLDLANSKKTEVFVDDHKDLDSKHFCHQGGNITSMTANVNIEHSHIGDLVVNLVSPSGKSVNLHNKTGGSQNDLVKSYSADDLKAFVGESARGMWKLEVNDQLKGDAGRLVSWGINIKSRK